MGMKGTVVNFRKSVHRQTNNQMIVLIEGVASKDKASELKGKVVTWATPTKRTIQGKITSTHGNKGAVRVLFEKGMPGQAVGKEVTIA